MSKYGIKIKNIKAGTLFGYNQGVRDRYDYTEAMFNNSLFNDFISKNGLKVYKEESTRDIICFEFDFGSRSYEEEIEHLNKLLNTKNISNDSINKINKIIINVKNNEDKYIKMSKDEIREHFYQHQVNVEYILRDKDGNIKSKETINYKMLYRSSAKAKIGQVMFINNDLYDIAYDWLTMGIGNKLPDGNAKIVELSAYAPLTTSTIVDKIHIPIEDILILKDQDSMFKTLTKVVRSEEYERQVKVIDEEKTELNRLKAINDEKFFEDGTPVFKKSYKKISIPTKKCIVVDEERDVKNTLWDGMGLVEDSYLPATINGMLLLRNHFFKMCGFRSKIQLFFQDWCNENGLDYDSYEVEDMFGVKHRLKDIKVITTDNSIKWKKFSEFMGNNLSEAYQYWCSRINADGSVFGIVKTDHKSKFGDVQQMSYQMINTLPCTKEDIRELASTSIEYVEGLKKDNDKFETFLRKNSTAVNHYEMMADLYNHNKEFANSTWFRQEKRKVINEYVNRLRKGKITINADNLTVCGNPYALLLYCVGADWKADPTLNFEKGTIQCYTSKFDDGEYLCAIRNPHNSPNNVCYLHNHYNKKMSKYFNFSDNILAVNCICSDIQDRANGMDFDSDFMFVTNNVTMVNAAKKCYEEYPTIVNALNESGITYENNMAAYAKMDNKFAKSRMGIGESSNLAMLALTYYWTEPSKDLYDNFVILSVLAQVIIDGCKREYEVDGVQEIDRIQKLDCMTKIIEVEQSNGRVKKKKVDFPKFMQYTRTVDITKNGKDRAYEDIKTDKEKIKNRINEELVCPMNWLEEVLDSIQGISSTTTIPTENFFIKMQGRTDARKISKIRTLVESYDNYCKNNIPDINDEDATLQYYNNINVKFSELVNECQKIKIGNIVTINRLIETSFGIEKTGNRYTKKGESAKYSRKLLNTLYRMDKEKFLTNFV